MLGAVGLERALRTQSAITAIPFTRSVLVMGGIHTEPSVTGWVMCSATEKEKEIQLT